MVISPNKHGALVNAVRAADYVSRILSMIFKAALGLARQSLATPCAETCLGNEACFLQPLASELTLCPSLPVCFDSALAGSTLSGWASSQTLSPRSSLEGTVLRSRIHTMPSDMISTHDKTLPDPADMWLPRRAGSTELCLDIAGPQCCYASPSSVLRSWSC